MSTYHTSVLVEEVIEGLNIEPGKKYIDATYGGGGHAKKIREKGGIVLGIDTDSDAISRVEQTTNLTVVKGNFRDIREIAQTNGFEQVSGILMDLGVSSYQFDTPEKGFSYRFLESPLDMRLDQTQGMTVAEYIKGAPEEELYEIFTKFGEEERARAIVHALIRTRQIKKITTVGQLVKSIDMAVGDIPDKFGVYSRVFQALRIYINDELGALRDALGSMFELLVPNGRLAIISFHSLEDRIVKQFMRSGNWKQVSKKPIVADVREITINKRSRSAKLRIVEKI